MLAMLQSLLAAMLPVPGVCPSMPRNSLAATSPVPPSVTCTCENRWSSASLSVTADATRTAPPPSVYFTFPLAGRSISVGLSLTAVILSVVVEPASFLLATPALSYTCQWMLRDVALAVGSSLLLLKLTERMAVW